MTTQKILIPGGSGFLGQRVAYYLKEKGFDIVILTRGKAKIKDGIEYVYWDGKTIGDWTKHLDGAHALINFTGKSINCIHNEQNKKEIIESRVDSIRVLTEAVLQSLNPPLIFIQSSASGIYKETNEPCNEDSSLGNDFLAEACKYTEAEFFKTTLPKTRKVIYRIGFVLDKNEGALKTLTTLTRYFLGGTIGSGKQYISWIHINDLNRMMQFAINHENIEGIYNAASPEATTNAKFMQTLRSILKRPWAPPAPTFMVKIGAFIIGVDPQLILSGRNITPQKLLQKGFQFEYTNLKNTLDKLLHSN